MKTDLMRDRFAFPFWLLGISLALLVLTSCGEPDVSGAYVSITETQIALIQLVSTPDKHVTGQLQMVRLNPDGTLKYVTSPITGVANNGTISLSLPSKMPLVPTMNLSGTYDRQQINFVGGPADQVGSNSIARGEISEYEAAQQKLVARSKATLAAKAEAAAKLEAELNLNAFVAKVDGLIGRMKTFDAVVGNNLKSMPLVQQKYADITVKLEQLLAKDQQIAGDPRAGFTRAQISGGMIQGQFATEGIHSQVNQLNSEFNVKAEPLMREVIDTQQSCHSAKRPDDNSPLDAWTAACFRLFEAFTPFKEQHDNMTQALAGLERSYQSEKQKQDQMVERADKLR